MLSERFREALGLAFELHKDQRRKGTDVPYLAHLLAVSAIVLEHGGGEDEAIAALLHDAAEDQGGRKTLERIRRRFGERVAAVVEGCTDAWEEPKPPWRGRKEAYLAHLPGADARVRLVSCADKLHNARAILADYRRLGEGLWARFQGGREGTLWYYRALADAFLEHGPPELARELDEVVRRLEAEATSRGAS